MSRSKNRKIADLISGGTFDDGVVAASEVTGLATVATSGSFSDLSNQPAAFDPATLASVAVSGSFSDLSNQPTPFDPSTLGTASTQATGAFATAAQGTTADAALPKAGGAVTGNVTFGDSNKVVMGAGSDLELYHDGSHSYIKENGTGQLKIRSNGTGVILQTVSGENLATFANNAAVTLYNNNASKMSTTTSGIDVTGTVNADALTGIGSIDATTKNAISAAGVGGLTTLVADDVAFGTGNVVKLSLGDYTKQTFWIRNIRSQTDEQGELRMTDSSDNPITSSTYCGLTFVDGTFSTQNDAVKIQFSTNRLPTAAETTRFQDLTVTVYNAYSSSIRTQFAFSSYKSKTNGGGANDSRHCLTGIMETPQRNQSLYFINDGSTFLTGATYTSIGVN